jgi:hypothetical protein
MRVHALVFFTVLASFSAHAGGLPTFDALNWVQNFLTATEQKLANTYAATQNAQSAVANTHLLQLVNAQVQQIDGIVRQYQSIEKQTKMLMGDGKDFSHLLVPAFRPWAEGVDLTNWSEVVSATSRFGRSQCIPGKRPVRDQKGNEFYEYYYPLTGEKCLGDRSTVDTGLGGPAASIRDLTYGELMDGWFARNSYKEKVAHQTIREEYDSFRTLSAKLGIESQLSLDFTQAMDDPNNGVIANFRKETKDAEALADLAKINNYILLQLLSVNNRALRLDALNAEYEAELLRIEYNKAVKSQNTFKW